MDQAKFHNLLEIIQKGIGQSDEYKQAEKVYIDFRSQQPTDQFLQLLFAEIQGQPPISLTAKVLLK